jgi:hypothetical protein
MYVNFNSNIPIYKIIDKTEDPLYINSAILLLFRAAITGVLDQVSRRVFAV